MKNDGHYAIRGSLHEAKLSEIAHELRKRLPPSMGFTILLYDISVGNDHGGLFYASTSTREENIELLTEHLKYLKDSLPKLNPNHEK